MLYVSLAYKKILSEKLRLFSTVLGIATVALIMHVCVTFSNAQEVFQKTEANDYLLKGDMEAYGRAYLRELYFNPAGVISSNEVTPDLLKETIESHPELLDSWGDLKTFDRIPANFLDYLLRNDKITGVCVRTQETIEANGILAKEYPFSISFADAVDTRYDTFSKNALDSLLQDENNAFLFGRDFYKGEKRVAIISDYTLVYMQKEANDLLGKRIVLKNKEKELSFEIVGVYDHILSERYWSVDLNNPFFVYDTTRAARGNEYIPDIVFSKDVIDELSPVGQYENEEVVITVDELENVLKVRDEIDRAFNVRMLCTYTGLAGIKENMRVYNHMFTALGGIAALTSVIMLLSSLTRVIDTQRESFVTYNLLGMKKSQVNRVIFCQSMIYGLIGWGIGSVAGFSGAITVGVLLLLGTPEFQEFKSIIPSIPTLLKISALFWVIMILLSMIGVLFGRYSLKSALNERNGENV